MAACQSSSYRYTVYESDAFSIYDDKVVQGQNVAFVKSRKRIQSNYKSPASQTYSSLVKFKFSINEKDNELPPGKDHWVAITDQKESPVIKFGEMPEGTPEVFDIYLPTNYEYTFRVDMSPVMEAFETKGYYEAYDGTKVTKEDFKGFFIAGGSEPLTWDFVNLNKRGLLLTDTGADNIYSITLLLNPFNEEDYKDKVWSLSQDLSGKPKYESNQSIVDALFNLSLEEAILNIEEDSTLRTGAKWGGVWTRDISYSIYLAFAYHEPEIAKISLLKKVKRNRIIQDTGSGGAWPISSDRTTWAIAAWEVYKTTGDMEWLRQAYNIIKNTIEDDARTIASSKTGLYSGESSFLDWREQTYPKWMSNVDIYVSQNLGTNVVHYQTHMILAQMARQLGEPDQKFLDRAQLIKDGINNFLWMEDKGYYAQFLYGRNYLNPSQRFEALGEALAVIFDVADENRAISILERSPITPFGTTCIYPQIPGIPPYHNNGIWPFVQSYWNLAAARAKNEKVLEHGLASIYRAGALFLTNYENFVAETGDFLGTEINSHRMLWSMAGNLAMVHRIFIGMQFEVDGIRFKPVVPEPYDGTRTLSNFKYRDAILDISVEGFGANIQSITLDGSPLENAFLRADISGKHSVVITLDNQSFNSAGTNLVKNKFSPESPRPQIEDSKIVWEAVKNASKYRIYKNGEIIKTTEEEQIEVNLDEWAEYKLSALGKDGIESFTSEPIMTLTKKRVKQIQFERFTKPSDLPYTDYTGTGFIEVSNDINRELNLTFQASKTGLHRIDFRYANGSGPWNTDNKCALRSLYINDEYIGAMVFPQRGKDEWSDWGYSNAYSVYLKKGNNKAKIIFEESNINMNVDVNTAVLDHIRVIDQSNE